VKRSVTIKFYASLRSLVVSNDASPIDWTQIGPRLFKLWKRLSDSTFRGRRSLPWAQLPRASAVRPFVVGLGLQIVARDKSQLDDGQNEGGSPMKLLARYRAH